jgi:hypothetical protein
MAYSTEQVAWALRTAIAVSVGICSVVSAAELPPEGGSHTSSVSLRSVRVEPATQDGTTRVVIDASGALPEPASGTAIRPPRIYVDFTDVLPIQTVEPVSPNPVVARVRVAEHSASPLVTRVVVDLIKEATYQIDSSARAAGRVILIIETREPRIANAPATRSQPPTASVTRPEASSEKRAARSEQLRGSSPEAQYGLRVAAILVRLHARRPLLEAIDRRADTIPGDLDAAAREFDDDAKLLTAIKPPSSRTSTHALLMRTCTLGARAARLRQAAATSQDAASGWEAASAAAGALLMLDRATGELGLK